MTFKEGQVVRCIRSHSSGVKEGEIYLVVGVRSYGDIQVKSLKTGEIVKNGAYAGPKENCFMPDRFEAL